MKTFYWYDYETFGINPKRDKIAQFAGIRTDEQLNIVNEQMFYCQPTRDCLPTPEACAITDITPQLCAAKGQVEHQFIRKINREFTVPNTCVAGYNSIRFDDEFTRHTLYRNFLDPYAWHWQNGNTRWDILDVVRLCYALKKDHSLEWVYDDDKPIFKLDKLAPANGIEHSDAHDALADVRATIAIAKIIKDKQPKLFNYAFSLREKKTVARKIQNTLFEPMLHTSGMYSAALSCTRLCTALAYHPEYNDRAIVFNLDQNPECLLDLDIETLKTRLFSKQSDLPEGVERLQIKELVFNKSPMFVPNIHKLEPNIIAQLKLDMARNQRHLDFIKRNQIAIQKVVRNLYQTTTERPISADVDQTLYAGFMDKADKAICHQIQTMPTDKLAHFQPQFKNPKLNTLLLHFKARNYPQTLSEAEQERWFEIVQGRVQSGENGYLSLESYAQSIAQMRHEHPQKMALWQQLSDYGDSFL